ncbi:MAG: alpha/beta hydrolase [Dermatophilaceae bacterium]|nr:alpha/beta hydrolase [Dermatophilaceae bacterium]
MRSQIVAGLVLIGAVTDPKASTWPRILGQWLRTVAQERLAGVSVLIRHYRYTGAAAMVRGMDAMRWHHTDQGLARLDIPVVVIRGSRDRIASQDWSARLCTIARGRLQVVGGAAHMVPLTHPEPVVAAVREIASAATSEGPGSATHV